MIRKNFHIGDAVIYTKSKFSERPGPRAKEVHPAENGDTYTYLVDKFWTVIEVGSDSLLLLTRRGKKHRVSLEDPNLRPAHWWEKWWYQNRFPQVPDSSLVLKN